jgi:AcrR family transcriptional regulator
MSRTVEQPRNARGRRTAAALLAAAREIVDTAGFEALTMAAVAERAGVSRRAIYLHFTGRTELLAALYRSLGETEDLAVSLRAVWESPDGVAALDEWARHIARSHPRILATLQAIEHSRRTDSDAAALWDTTMRNWHKSCRRLADWLRRDGRLAPGWTVESAADLLWSLMSLDLLDRLVTDRRWSRTRFADRYGSLLRSTFVD